MKKNILILILLYSINGYSQFVGSSQFVYQRTIGETNKYFKSGVGLEIAFGYMFNDKLEAYIKPSFNNNGNISFDLSANYYLNTKRVRPYVMLAGVLLYDNDDQKHTGIRTGVGVEWEKNMFLELSFLSAGNTTKEGDFIYSTQSYKQISVPYNMISFGIGYRLKVIPESEEKRKIKAEKLKNLDLKEKKL